MKHSEGDPAGHRPAARRGPVPRVGRLKEMPPFGDPPDAAYPPKHETGGAIATARPHDDDPLGLFLPMDRAGD